MLRYAGLAFDKEVLSEKSLTVGDGWARRLRQESGYSST